MKKEIVIARVDEACRLNGLYTLLKLSRTDGGSFAGTRPGQFVEVQVPGGETLLRRPISVNNVDEAGRLWLLVRKAGRGTARLVEMTAGDSLNIVTPLGNGFTVDFAPGSRVLLAGGGVGVAPMLYLGKYLKDKGVDVEFLLAARSKGDLLELEEFEKIAPVNISTDDGSAGEPGLITANSALGRDWDMVCVCGPAPMMRAVADICRRRDIECEVSLENMMACGVGACLCCVEKTVKGNVCVCTEGPVFNIKQLTW
ncbi:MAG: dihydroorotate dehydrogenase electron transfer subunit [Muribaculaceae bacterium]|nr:dihydroorotate dehydrogenase electron transfer subunit [Muribaculaceae bacterium]